jgi:hypothetical protein
LKVKDIKTIEDYPNRLKNPWQKKESRWWRRRRNVEASPHQRWLNVTQIPVPGGWQHIYYNRWISLLHHCDIEGTEVPTLQGTTQTLTTTLQ